MPQETKNSLRSSSIIRAVDAGTYTIALADLTANSSIETVNNASIKSVMWSTNGSIAIVRNSVPLLMLHGAGEMRIADMGHVLANNSGSSIIITINTGGTIILEVTKDSTYTPGLIGI
ncbi:hypothetical protein M0R04_05345 [Candidatus Dojkabacteria bacterium]|jgi:hypothetical protein|nr:hypothetical protein [Candidatus Dojkabacteria bacterium]